ncbi:hypothetical protein [Nannocystis pusilla]|uniref:hypothetical protein n=1 Tax=Nannocystis pusilla TaxID=889268 RepID=UPI003B75F43E
MPYASDGGSSWQDTKCSPIAPNPAGVGEPCQAIGSWTSGEDTCDKHMMCWPDESDDLSGTCVAFCDGSPDAPSCAPKTLCHVSGSGVLLLCLPMCDPILQDCPSGDLCILNPDTANGSTCVLDASGEEGQAFDPCEFVNACDPGLFCVSPALASECDPEAEGCCLPVCDLNAPNTCPGAGQSCLPWPGRARRRRASSTWASAACRCRDAVNINMSEGTCFSTTTPRSEDAAGS